jgi:hypothetical protein
MNLLCDEEIFRAMPVLAFRLLAALLMICRLPGFGWAYRMLLPDYAMHPALRKSPPILTQRDEKTTKSILFVE